MDNRRVAPLEALNKMFAQYKITEEQTKKGRELVFMLLTINNNEAFELLEEYIYKSLWVSSKSSRFLVSTKLEYFM